MNITEQARLTEVTQSCDVLVCGGGVAGISAALAAAREGARVLLAEREWLLGGLASAGLVTIYLPLCDGLGRQVSFGIAEELLRLSVKHGAERGCDEWLGNGSAEERAKKRFQVQFNPNLFALEAENLLLQNGVELLYGTQICSANVNGGRISHIVTESKSGRTAIETGFVVDCTGDADVCALAGEKTELFRQGNLPAGWFYTVKDGRYTLNITGACDKPDKYKTPEQLEKAKNDVRFTGVDAKELSDITVLCHAQMLEKHLESGDGTPEKALAQLPCIPQVRMTRRLSGRYTLDDTQMHTEFADSVGLFSDWRKSGPVYELPFDTLRGEKISNLLAAGRCISATEAMWDITRVIPVCAVSGEAAGTAAAMSCGGDIDVPAVQKKLVQNGVKLHEKDL